MKTLIVYYSLEAEVVLIDPQNKSNSENEQKFKVFCERLDVDAGAI